MPDKPVWYSHLEKAERELAALPSPWVDRQTIESVLGVGRRRAQQILKPLVRHTVGKNGLALKEEVILYLRQLAEGDTAAFERRRRERLRELITVWHHDLQTQPRVLVEAPTAIVNQELKSLPPGVHLSPGRIVIEGFQDPEDARQKLLALIMAIGNDPDEFDKTISST